MKIFVCIIVIVISVSLIFAMNGCGDKGTGDNSGSSAVDTTPPAAIANLAIIGIVDSTCLLSWTVPGDDGFSGQASTYDIRYSTDSLTLSQWDSAYRVSTPPTPGLPGTTQQFTVTGLYLDSSYYFGIRTVDDVGNISTASNISAEHVSEFPQVYVTSPQNGDSIRDFVEITVLATDDKGITKVEFIVDTVLIETDITPPFGVFWDAHAYQHGSTHTIYAKAYDTDGNFSGSSIIICYVDTNLFAPYALSFIGNTYCVIPHYAELDFTNEFTIEAWVNIETGTNHSRVIEKTESSCCFQYNLIINGGQVGIDLGKQTGNYIRLYGNNVLPLNEWNHISVSYSSGVVCIYINGVLDKCETTTITSLDSFATDLRIGRRKLFNEFGFPGSIDEIRLWNYARTEAQLFASFDSVLSGVEPGLVGYWRFDESSGDTINAIVGNNGHLGLYEGVDDGNDPVWVPSTAPIQY